MGISGLFIALSIGTITSNAWNAYNIFVKYDWEAISKKIEEESI